MMPEGQETYVTARVLGTFGYFDPEYTSVRIFEDQWFSLLYIIYVSPVNIAALKFSFLFGYIIYQNSCILQHLFVWSC